MTNRLRSWWDVNLFILRTLSPGKFWVFIVSSFLFVLGLGLELGDVYSNAWKTALLGVPGILWEMWGLCSEWLSSPDAILKTDEKNFTISQRLELTTNYQNAGYCVEPVPKRAKEFIVRSRQIDDFLRGRSSDFVLSENKKLLDPIEKTLRDNSLLLEDILRCKYRRSWGAHPPKKFINEDKVCFGGDLFPGSSIPVFRGGYFHSFLTNELVDLVLESGGELPLLLYQGTTRFPAYMLDGKAPMLKHIGESYMLNDIGISTLVRTGDGKIVVWRQSERAQQSSNLLAPTGSGSCDWKDWTRQSGNKSLKALVVRAMEREFREESFKRSSPFRNAPIQTAIIGYFRWVRRGGRPEFVGFSKTDTPHNELSANPEEVQAPPRTRLVYPAGTFAELESSIAELIATPNLSVPLTVTLTCLSEALKADPKRWADFLVK